MSPQRRSRRRPARDVLELFVLAADEGDRSASILASFRNARVLERFPCRGGEAGARWHRIIRVHERTLASLAGRPGARGLPAGSELRAFGRDLFEALFPGDARRLYDTARSLQPRGVLDVAFTSMIDWVADKPWELAFDPSRREYLGTSCVNFVRNVFTAVPADEPGRRSGRLRVLVVSPAPGGVPQLAAREETTGLRAALRDLTKAELATVEVLPRPTASRLQQRLAEGGVDALHFIGHGVFDSEKAEGAVILEDERGRPRTLGFDGFRQIVCRRGLRLVFLNACETGRGGRLDWTRGVAPALVAAGLPAVVANQYPVLDAAAVTFAHSLYGALARRDPLGDAAREARLAVARQLGGDSLDWAVPVLFARDPREPLR